MRHQIKCNLIVASDYSIGKYKSFVKDLSLIMQFTTTDMRIFIERKTMELKNTQQLQHQLKLTQEMRTSIQLLAFSTNELIEYIREEAENNPVVDSDQLISDLARHNEEIDSYAGQRFQDSDELQKNKDYQLESITDSVSMCDFLEEQLDRQKLSEPVLNAALWIINSLDKDGYFLDEDFLPEPFHPYYAEALEAVQSLSPAGIGSRSLSESLLIQADRSGIDDPVLKQMIRKNLRQLADHRFDELNSIYRIKNSRDYLEIIRSFNPRPASGIPQYEAPQQITVDIFFEKDETGRVIPRLNDRYIPTLTINTGYTELIERLDEESKDIYLNYTNRISYLNQSILKRNDTLIRVSQAIIERQKRFFQGQSQYLGPLTLNEIAVDIGNHVSTVSRAVRDKYVSFN